MATWRSAVGIDEENRILYYAAGWSMGIPVLARAIKHAGIYSAIQLDINYYWVLFTTVDFIKGEPHAVPLLEQMKDGVDRYLAASPRDFFYIAAKYTS